KIKLAKELAHYDKVKDNEQIKALVDFLEYLFLIQDPELEKKYENYSKPKACRTSHQTGLRPPHVLNISRYKHN
ncbi:MAG: hypothetical protein ACRC68_03045, partial [Clostridium sp.]